MCAIIVAKLIGISNENIRERIMSFKAVEHRIEYTATVNGKAFYNDSKATNPEAAIVVLKSKSQLLSIEKSKRHSRPFLI